jgi:mannosyltransferase OCH1-like enzyme
VVQTLTDATRLALVYKVGGIYADLDMLFTNITLLGEAQRWLAQDGGEVDDDSVKLNSAVIR